MTHHTQDISINGKAIALLVTDGVEQPELTEPLAAIREAGGTAKIISPNKDSLQAMKGDWEHADHFDVDHQLGTVSAGDFDALVLPGGTLNADSLRIDERAQTFVAGFFSASKPVASICHGLWILTVFPWFPGAAGFAGLTRAASPVAARHRGPRGRGSPASSSHQNGS